MGFPKLIEVLLLRESDYLGVYVWGSYFRNLPIMGLAGYLKHNAPHQDRNPKKDQDVENCLPCKSLAAFLWSVLAMLLLAHVPLTMQHELHVAR